VHIRILACDECPNTRATEALVAKTLEELGVKAHLDFVEVHNEAEAAAYRFLGSPSVQVDGKDVEKERREDAPLFGCRLYTRAGRRTGVPPRDMIVRAIQEALPAWP
jgi:hypothetical protein